MSSETSLHQPSDNTETRVAVRNKLSSRIEQQRRKEELNTEAYVRELIREAENAIVGENDTGRQPEEILEELHLYLWHDPDRPVATTEADVEPDMIYRFNQIHRRFETGHDIDAATWFEILVAVAKGLGIVEAFSDLTQYAPVRLETLDEQGRQSNVETATPIGRRRIGADDAADLEDRAVEITHSSCDHILAVALPRSGKDSTITSIGMNLWKEHNYSYFSILDDGRMETPMISVPNDEKAIRENLDRMGQEPAAFDAEVLVPAMDGIPAKLPANFRPFTIGIDDLTPHLILRLAGITKSDANTEQRIKQALDKTLERTGEVTELVSRLQVYAEEMDATIEWTEKRDSSASDGNGVQTKSVQYHMEAEDALNKAAQRLAHLAGEGLVASPEAETNIDMQSVIANQEQATVLCCNFLSQGQEALKYTIMDLWLRLIYKARDQNSRLPRVCLEIRELKNIAPSKLADVRYKDTIKTLRQTIFFISTQGGSRRILMLGSTQKLNDVYKPVRSNMATKILLRLGEEEIETLDRSYNFSNEQMDQLSEFNIGQGMILAGGDAFWPLEFRGAPCGLGLGDRHWLDRYGIAWGARVRETEYDGWRSKHGNCEYWVNLAEHTVVTDESVPEVGTWHLLPVDFDDDLAPADVDQDAIDAALQRRRDYPVPADLSLQSTGFGDRQRELSLQQQDRDTTLSEVVERHNIPESIAPWLSKETPTRKQLVATCRAVDEHDDLKRQEDIAENIGWTRSTLSRHLGKSDSLEKCITQNGKYYELTPIGKRAAEIRWDVVMEELK
ncbi:hypothetical protein [Natrialba asiatica]|uniref:Uncharacterized protein n=1 Tax=Natrialba asiatica (strain ATCC 700177 / DSM 12278 / JCM 9576 / FERM P-10747 / NBRC 102637 / 172P1) TaxID=29540 RepID=M0AGY9_NATA1|nr:hypothetical protein [Natrialba asiatica]ELY97162.1 hypothetical protein C481_21276 [Natrialba asiatica DSM 12278]